MKKELIIIGHTAVGRLAALNAIITNNDESNELISKAKTISMIKSLTPSASSSTEYKKAFNQIKEIIINNIGK